MKANIHTLMAGSLMLTVALAAGCERESKGPRAYNHPPATVGPPADLSQFDAPAPPAPGEAKPVPVAQVAAPAPAADSLELRPEVADVVDMAKRGVGDEALLAFVEQNPVIHRIAPETIIFLNDLGVPENVVALMIRQGDAVEDRAGWSADGAGPGDGTTGGEHAAASAAAPGERSAGGQQPLLRRTRPVRRLVLRRLTRLGVAADRGRGRCRLAAVQPGRALDLQ